MNSNIIVRIVLACTLWAITIIPSLAFEQQGPYNVMLIYPDSRTNIWAEELIKGFQAGAAAGSVRVNIFAEPFDTNIANAADRKAAMHQVCDHARREQVSLILAVNDTIYETLMHCDSELPLQIPMIVSRIRYVTPEVHPNVCGFVTPVDYMPMLESAHAQFPHRTEVIFMYDNSPYSIHELASFRETFAKFKARYPEYSYETLNLDIEGLGPIESICDVNAASHNVVIVPRWSNAHSFIGKNSKAPFFSVQYSALGNGVFGIYGSTIHDEAFESGKLASYLFSGELPSSIGFQKMPSRLLYDYNQLVYFDINPHSIPDEHDILNMPFSVRYNFWLILGYIVTIAAVLFALIWSNRMRRREKRRRNYAQARLLIQSRLVEQRNEFNEVLSSLPDGIVTFDTNLKVHLMNHSFLRMLGKDNNGEGINYQNMDTSSIFHIHLNGEDITYALLKKACDEQRVIPIPDNTFLEVVATKNYFPISGEILPTYSHKRLTGVMLSCRNISTDELNKRFFRLAVEASAIYPCSYDINTQLFSYSKSVYGRLGIDANTPLSLDFIRSIIHPDDVERMTQGFRDVCSGVRSDYRDEMRVNVLGTYEWMSFFCIAYKGFTAETPYRVLSVAQSIQQYKEVQEELIAARDKALETDKLKSAFLANMSHEIRTPLNAIVGFSDLLRVIDAFTADEVREFIETINVNCSLLLSLINDILDLARIEAGSMEFRIEHQRLSPVLHDIYDSQRYSMPHDVELILDVPDNDAEVSIDTDAVRLKQVLNNLINNAKKFTSKGSITFGYQYYDDHTMFYVEDTGIGMSEEEQHRVFERFYKVNTFTQGAGLGLSICLTIIDFFNGSIDVTSKPNVGTRFTIIVPNKQLTK